VDVEQEIGGVDDGQVPMPCALNAGLGSANWSWLAADVHRQRGEFVLVLHGRTQVVEAAAEAHDPMLRTLLASLPLKQAVALAAELSGAPRNALYERALALKDGGT